MRKILLNKNKSKKSINNDNFISISIDRDMSLFNNDVLSETIDILQLYNNEKNNSNKHRFIFTLTPVCTNSLFNYLTEIIYKEGSNNCELITDEKNFKTSGNPISKEPLNRTQAIRNTEYSNSEFNLNYHCGIDIFNNHLFRSDNFISVQKVNENNICEVFKYDEENKSYYVEKINSFNTIGDYKRNSDGNKYEIPFPANSDYTYRTITNRNEPLYIYDDIKTFNKSYKDNLKRKDGWLGFYNKTTMSIPVNNSGNDYYVNKIINNVNSCKFINLSPERDLFLFTPKKNEYRKRVEHNWDYCLTYPSESIYEDDFILKGKGYGLPLIPFENGLYYKNNNSSAGTDYITFRSAVKHNLNVGNFINLKYKLNEEYYSWDETKGEYILLNDKPSDSTTENTLKVNSIPINKNDSYSYLKLIIEGDIKCKVYQIGDENNKYNDRYFSILKDDLFDFIPLEYYSWDEAENSYKKNNGKPSNSINQNTLKVDLIPPIQNVFYTFLKKMKDVESFRFAKVVNGFECEYYFRKFKKINNNLKKTINKLAFSNNIYGEDVSQLIFLDDINIINLKDNRNRPLTEVYLTILKRNKGYKEWYENNVYNSETIEFSRVFGKVTSGLDLPPYAEDLPTIRYQHNINPNDYEKLTIRASSQKVEDNITIDLDEFYGDLVEFNPITVDENVLEVFKHRFNTAQRETNNTIYNTITYDDIYSDIYDYNQGSDIKNNRIIEKELNKGFANLNCEGYIYVPHHKIKIGESSNIVSQGNDSVIVLEDLKYENGFITFKTSINYKLLVFDVISLQLIVYNNDKKEFRYHNFEVTSSILNSDKKYCCIAKLLNESSTLIDDINNNDGVWFKHNQDIPEYAYILPDATGRHIWRQIIPPSDYSPDSELYKTPFTNGAFYHHTNIIFPIRRQNPFNLYDINIKDDEGNVINNNFVVSATELDVSDIEYIQETQTTCF